MSRADTSVNHRANRITTLAVALLVVVPMVVSWGAYLNALRTICDTCILSPEYVQMLEARGIPLRLWVAWKVGLHVLIAVGWSGVGLYIVARKANDQRAMLMGLLLVLVAPGFGGVPFELIDGRAEWWLLQRTYVLVSGLSVIVLLCLFPNGRLAPRWSLWLLLYQGALLIPNAYFANSRLNFGTWPVWLRLLLFFTPFIATLVVVPVYRYLRVLTPVERQQTKWAVLGFMAAAGGIVFTISITGRCANNTGLQDRLYCDVSQDLGFGVSPLLIPLFISIAILRSRLWDIDVIIRRTLVYGWLTAILSLIYLGSIVLLQALLRPLVGAETDLATVGSTLAIVALFQPLRRHIQAVIDRRFYRRKYDAAKTLQAFNARVRDQVELSTLTDDVLDIVQDTLQPAHVSLWLRPTGRR